MNNYFNILQKENFQKLSKAEMKNVLGGRGNNYECFAVTASGGQGQSIWLYADNVDEAQGRADTIAYQPAHTQTFPYGIDCPGAGAQD
jgi:natural product precursor